MQPPRSVSSRWRVPSPADLPQRNIRVDVVAPGATKTPIWNRGPRTSISTDESAKLATFFSSAVPLGRWGEAKDVANARALLASDDSSYGVIRVSQ